MIRNWDLLQDIQEKIKKLTPEEQLYLIQRIAGQISREHFTDHEELARLAKEMASDPDIQRVLRDEDLPGLEQAYFPSTPNEERAAS